MMRDIKESDWKFLRTLHSVALERFSEQILLDLQRINSDKAKSFHQEYLEIYTSIHQRDKEMARTFDGLRRSTALIQLASIKRRGLLTDDEFLCFSKETRDRVELLLNL